MNRQNDHTKTVLLAIGAGLLGASVALLFAPQSGKKTRRGLQRFGGNVSRRAEDLYEDLTDRLEEMVTAAETIGSNGLEKGKETGQKIQNELVRRLEASKDLISKQITRIESLRKAS